MKGEILIIDYGSQYNQLIARRVRENKVYCRIVPPNIRADEIEKLAPSGIILSGGPSSVYLKKGPSCEKRVLELGVPILGICYGMQLITKMSGGVVKKTKKREYGKAVLRIDKPRDIFSNLPKKFISWMSHGDYVAKIPPDFIKLAHTNNTRYAAIRSRSADIFGVQFHPEVMHTQFGTRIISNFLFKVCGCKRNWTMKSFIKNSVQAYIGCISGAIKKDEYLKAIEAAGFQQVSVVDEATFPIESMVNDPTAQAVIKMLNITPEDIKEFGSSVISAKVSGVKPIR